MLGEETGKCAAGTNSKIRVVWFKFKWKWGLQEINDNKVSLRKNVRENGEVRKRRNVCIKRIMMEGKSGKFKKKTETCEYCKGCDTRWCINPPRAESSVCEIINCVSLNVVILSWVL